LTVLLLLLRPIRALLLVLPRVSRNFGIGESTTPRLLLLLRFFFFVLLLVIGIRIKDDIVIFLLLVMA
jgi:hypothetical protein